MNIINTKSHQPTFCHVVQVGKHHPASSLHHTTQQPGHYPHVGILGTVKGHQVTTHDLPFENREICSNWNEKFANSVGKLASYT